MLLQRKVNRNIRVLVGHYIESCMPGTWINTHDLARQLANRNRVFLAGTIAAILHDRRDLRCGSITDYQVVR
jgi:hypothetical protein